MLRLLYNESPLGRDQRRLAAVGLFRSEMTPEDWEKLQTGSTCLRAVSKIIAECNRSGVPW
eukprot:3858002-Pyramimonas_sp.AAC.1